MQQQALAARKQQEEALRLQFEEEAQRELHKSPPDADVDMLLDNILKSDTVRNPSSESVSVDLSKDDRMDL